MRMTFCRREADDFEGPAHAHTFRNKLTLAKLEGLGYFGSLIRAGGIRLGAAILKFDINEFNRLTTGRHRGTRQRAFGRRRRNGQNADAGGPLFALPVRGETARVAGSNPDGDLHGGGRVGDAAKIEG